jgi:hypothetical protein
MGSVSHYQFNVLETHEVFKSPEKDVCKAFLLHQKTKEQKPLSSTLQAIFKPEHI